MSQFKNIRYNSKELRLEKLAPVYDENEVYERHVWAAMVTEDVEEIVVLAKKEMLEELLKAMKTVKL